MMCQCWGANAGQYCPRSVQRTLVPSHLIVSNSALPRKSYARKRALLMVVNIIGWQQRAPSDCARLSTVAPIQSDVPFLLPLTGRRLNAPNGALETEKYSLGRISMRMALRPYTDFEAP